MSGLSLRIVRQPITRSDLQRLAREQFGEFIKAVVDVGRGMMAIGGDLHADEEAALLQDGAHQSDLWGINLFPDHQGDELIEFDSMINVRPSQGNRSRDVQDAATRRRIREIVEGLISQ